MNQNLTDNELLKLIVCDDRAAFTKLYSRYLNSLYRYIYLICKSKETSEEIVQDVFVMVWENRKTFNNITSFKSYIYRCAKNALLNQIKKSQTEARIMKMRQSVSDEQADNSDYNIIYKQHYQIAREAVDMLPEKRKQIFNLSTVDELSLSEIAEKLSISKSVVKKQLYLGRSFIKEYLQKMGIHVIGLIFLIHILYFRR